MVRVGSEHHDLEVDMAVGKHHRMDKEAREFSKKLLGRGGFVPYRPPRMPEEPAETDVPSVKPEKKRGR
jgi:hypothetical protein